MAQQVLVVEGSEVTGTPGVYSQLFCHPNLMNALACMERRTHHVHGPHQHHPTTPPWEGWVELLAPLLKKRIVALSGSESIIQSINQYLNHNIILSINQSITQSIIS